MKLPRFRRPAAPVDVVSMPPECGADCVNALIGLNVQLSEAQHANKELFEQNGEYEAEIERLTQELARVGSERDPAPQPFARPWPRSAKSEIARLRANLVAMEARARAAEETLKAERRSLVDAARRERTSAVLARFGIGSQL